MKRSIRFKIPNRYGVPVHDERSWDEGVMQLLVQRGIAEWVEPEKPKPVKATAAISQPVAESLVEKPEPQPEKASEPKEPTKRTKRSETQE